jgi:serine/threonine-protein kinase
VLDLGAADEPQAPRLSEERYSIEGEIGVGGMGKVLNVYDQDLRRRVAMKVLREEVRDPRAVARFFEEAQATGQLEHPNIAPVYDLGMDRQHGVFFTMKLVRGRNLREILRDLSVGRLETRRHYTLTRLLQILQQVAMGIHFAHARGVIHRDLKPDNIMVGDFGEVFVMDWGLAKIVDRRLEPGASEGITSLRQESGHTTLDGTVSGTPSYMSPEQARGWVDEIDERTDVFGLGAILYEILTFHPPYQGASAREILAKAGAAQVTPPHVRAPRNNVPAALESACLRALAAAKEDRFRTASELHEALQVFLDGTLEAERRRQEAAALARQGKEEAREYKRLADEEARLRRIADEELSSLRSFDPAERKAATWSLEDRAAEARQQRLQAFNEATATLHAAINIDPGCGVARESLADLYWQRFEEAERAGNLDDQTIYRSLVERYHNGKLARLLEGKGSLSLETDPPGAAVTLHRLDEKERRLQEDEGVACGVTPLKLEVPIGHHLLVIRKEGYRDVRYPILMTRLGRELAKVNLYRDDEIGAGFVYIPAGDFFMGGDGAASGSVPLCRRYVPDLFVGEHPVTFRQYAAFLDDLRRAGDPELAQCLPRTDKEGDCVRLGPDGRYEPAGDVIDIDLPTRARHPEGFEWELPVFAVSWYAACRYARWYTETTGRQARLLRDAEWEKAARGVARTIHPWGDRFDWSFVKGGLSRPERSQPEPVGAFPCDRSVYGVRDLAGTIIEWCEDWFLENKYRLTRGGGWYSINEAAFRAAFRLGTNPVNRSSLIGFRIAVEPGRRR